jgi:hypothetical protein
MPIVKDRFPIRSRRGEIVADGYDRMELHHWLQAAAFATHRY